MPLAAEKVHCGRDNLANTAAVGNSWTPAPLPERWLVEAAELAGVEAGPLLAQEVHGRHADLQVLADGAVVEGVGLAGQLDLAVQRLVGNAQQGAVGHPEAVPLGRDRGAFHV